MARNSVVALLSLALGALLAAACGGGGEEPAAASPGPSPALTAVPPMTPTPTASVALPSPIASPVVLAGITLQPGDAWFRQGGSRCARINPESPYFAPEVFSIREEELPKLTLPAGEPWGPPRVCKHGITAIGYISEHTWVILTDGPHEWPVYASADEISARTVAGRPAVFLTTQRAWLASAMVIVAEEFGLTVIATAGTLEEAAQIAEAIDRDDIEIPQGKDTFSGTLNGIRLYDYLHGENRKEGCPWGVYGVEGRDTRVVEIPPDTPLDVFPSYLPEGYSLFEKTGTACGGTIDLVEAHFSPKPGFADLSVLRFSGEAAWYSPFSEDWLTPATVAGHSAVFIAPPAWVKQASEYRVELVVKEDFGLTVVAGRISLEEAKRVAAGLNR